MNFLLDENLSPLVAKHLNAAGYSAVHVRDLSLQGSSDDEVIRHASQSGRILVSSDTDFGTLLARSGATSPSFVLIRRAADRRAADQARLLLDNLPAVAEDLAAGAVVVLGEEKIRIRRLPI
ncbi:DUF5615 family PIN-like protein [Gordonia sp. FQ]|uniref:DUF5615 family PIN-like protein n=1 Tax=Gordonia sp. FQ TaxID=3446634 RepID=UPI003F83A437